MTTDAAPTPAAPPTQTELIESQKVLVDGERRLYELLTENPIPQGVVDHLVEHARLASASRLSRQASYLARLQSRTVPLDEVEKSVRVQARFAFEQAQFFSAIGEL